MKIRAVLFDLDGTLLPLDQSKFIKEYFKGLVDALSPLGCDPKALEGSIWAGTVAMIKNDGTKTNEEAFYNKFSSLCQVDMEAFDRLAREYYRTEYKKLENLTKKTPLAKTAVALAGECGRRVVLATNPLFPREAQEVRIAFAGLCPSDFELITSYESDKYAKPSTQYYTSIAKRLGLSPDECVMIGNDEEEDMRAASSVGMRCFLIEDCVISSSEHPWDGERGSFEDMLEFLKKLN